MFVDDIVMVADGLDACSLMGIGREENPCLGVTWHVWNNSYGIPLTCWSPCARFSACLHQK